MPISFYESYEYFKSIGNIIILLRLPVMIDCTKISHIVANYLVINETSYYSNSLPDFAASHPINAFFRKLPQRYSPRIPSLRMTL